MFNDGNIHTRNHENPKKSGLHFFPARNIAVNIMIKKNDDENILASKKALPTHGNLSMCRSLGNIINRKYCNKTYGAVMMRLGSGNGAIDPGV